MSKPKIAVVDYGLGNLLSVQRALERCGASVTICNDPERLVSAKKVLLPGVGAFGVAMEQLHNRGLVEAIRELPKLKVPLIGICLGMQLLLDESEEFGKTTGLGLIPGHVRQIPTTKQTGDAQKIPHIGWNKLIKAKTNLPWENTVLKDLNVADEVYFVHSFMAVLNDPSYILADCNYGGNRIPAVISKEGVTGCQFHPEKSGEIGLSVLKKFCFD